MKDPVITDNQLHPANHLQTKTSGSDSAPLTCNILSFEHPEKSMEFTFSVNENEGKYRFWIKKLPGEVTRFFPDFNPEHPFVYTNFDTSTNGIKINIDFNEQAAVARAWYTLKIRDFLSESANVTVTNFLNDCQYWYVEKDVNNSAYSVYKKFTLRVQNDHRSGKPELMVSYDGKSYILNKSLAQLTENADFDTRILKSVLFRKQTYLYDKIPDEALYHKDEIFPVINREIKAAQNITLPTGINGKKYLAAYNEIEAFYSKYLDAEYFRAIIPLVSKWKTISPGDIHSLSDTSRNLVFGEGNVSADIYNSLKTYGPNSMPGYKHTKIFMIYSANDREAAGKLKEYVIKKDGFGSLGAITHMIFEYDESLDIVFTADKNPIHVSRETMKTRTADPSCGYFAFYISPHTRFEARPENHEIYFKIKEVMLHRGIGLQVIERDKISGKFAFSIANIGIAMIAKMGGIPWRLSGKTDKELIIGFGAFKSQRYNTQYVGSAFCFSNEGVFHEFDCFPADETWSIAGSAEEALIAYRKSNPDVKRMVIHFYQKIGRKQLKPIEDMLRRLKFDIPVIIVRINKTFSESQLVFDNTFPGKMPLNGSYVHVGRQEYLLCNNQRLTTGSSPATLPLPVKVGLQSNQVGLLDDAVLVEQLIRQVYEFSFLYWRSVNQQHLPVTITYPEMVARMFTGFDISVLPEAGRKSMFFL